MSDAMGPAQEPLDFSTIADLFLSYGSLSSPSFFDGRMSAALALVKQDDDDATALWLEEICSVLGVAEPRTREDAAVLLNWRSQTREQLSEEQMDYEPLLPDELYSVKERAQSLQMWAQGFSEMVDDHGVDDDWSAPLREALDDLHNIAELNLDEGIEEDSDSEADLLALIEHARVTALTLHLECHPGKPQVFKDEDGDSPSQLH